MIETIDLKKSYGELAVLKGISTEIKKGETVAIIGPSGSGKSTFLRCLNLMEMPTEGDVLFKGMSLLEKSTKEAEVDQIRQEIGMVFQHFNLFPNMTVLENIILAPLKLKNKSKEEAIVQAEALLKKVGLLDKRDVYQNKLSGGQKQRVAIARALITNPKVILADEPTGALDSKTTHDIMKLLQDINNEGKTIIVVTHEPDVAAQTKRNVHLRDGVIETDEYIQQVVL